MIKEQDRPELREPIGVLGYGVEGMSTCAFLLARGYRDITVFDRKRPRDLDPRIRYDEGRGGDYLAGLAGMRTVFRSAGIRPDLPGMIEFLGRGGTLTSQTGLAFHLAGRERIIGVTGTLGKGTCCSLLHAMLAEAGIAASLGGNIGVPALDLAASLPPDGKLILELSSFQLSTLAVSPAFAAVLKTTSEHLDWHADRDEYWLHKANLVSSQTEGDFLTYYDGADAPGSAWIAARSPARKLAYGSGVKGKAAVRIEKDEIRWTERGFSLPLASTRLTGAFNLENLAAAGTLALELGAEPRHILAAAAGFAGLEHRLEFVRELRGVSFYNDSYATRPEASMGAIQALSGAPLGLILGGSDKQADFSDLARLIAASPHIAAIALIGQTAEKLESDLRAAGFPRPGSEGPRKCSSLEEALEYLHAKVERGAIALSPACASFGMFENYKERGKAFKRLAAGL